MSLRPWLSMRLPCWSLFMPLSEIVANSLGGRTSTSPGNFSPVSVIPFFFGFLREVSVEVNQETPDTNIDFLLCKPPCPSLERVERMARQ